MDKGGARGKDKGRDLKDSEQGEEKVEGSK